jgi:hypothetical protein
VRLQVQQARVPTAFAGDGGGGGMGAPWYCWY